MSGKVTSATPQSVAVVGLGFMGRGIATCLLGHGFRVIGCDHSAGSHEAARNYIERGLGELVEHAGLDLSMLQNWRARYQETRGFEDWSRCDFVIESVVEQASVKQQVYDHIERIVDSSVPIGSNTSAIPITDLQNGRKHPERFFGMHWFEPAHATRFVELIPGLKTSRAAMTAAVELARSCGKEPSVLAKDIPGFLINRLGYALYREALYLLELGIADAETIDRSFRNVCGVWATICGPFQWIDLTGGPALYAECMERVLPTLSNATEVPQPLRQLAAEDARGITSGRGFYTYTSQQAENASALFHQHAWKARDLLDEYYPLPKD